MSAALLDIRTWGLPFRIGATSYIIPDELLPNAQFLTAHVQDMQLVLFDVPGGPSNLPPPALVAALAAWGRAHDLTYTVHLLQDLRLRDEDGQPAAALVKAQEVMALTRPLAPQAWVCHLDGRAVRGAAAGAPQLSVWQAETVQAVRQVCGWAGDPMRVAVENLEGYAPEFVTAVVDQTAAGRCVDVGHLWLDGVDALPHLASASSRLRIVHLHGVERMAGAADGAQPARDHVSLRHAPPQQLAALLRWLVEADFRGVLSLEIFGEEDFWSSLAVLEAAVQRMQAQRGRGRDG